MRVREPWKIARFSQIGGGWGEKKNLDARPGPEGLQHIAKINFPVGRLDTKSDATDGVCVQRRALAF